MTGGESASQTEWYAVKGLFKWYFKETGATANVEERIVIFLAKSFDHALELAEVEAVDYCTGDEETNYRIEAMGWWNAYRIGEARFASGVEVYSRLMETQLSGESFIKRYFPKSHERG